MRYILILMTFLTVNAYADDCQDPEKLDPQMKKAYYQLVEASKQLGGFKVEILCEDKGVRYEHRDRGIRSNDES